MKRFTRSISAGLVLALLCAVPIAVPMQAQQPIQTIQQAVAAGKLVATIQGTGSSSGDSIKLKVRKGPTAGPEPVDATVPPGTKLASGGGGFQSMVVTGIAGEDAGGGFMRPASAIHVVGDAVTYILAAFCAEFEKENPSETNTFTLGPPDPMAACLAREGSSLSVEAMQAAVWMYTDNITFTHMNEKFDITAKDWAAAQKVYNACRARRGAE
jgi:hypothetical protein